MVDVSTFEDSDRCEISYAATLTRSMCRSTFEDRAGAGPGVGTLEISGGVYNTADFRQRDSWRKDTNICLLTLL